MTYRSYWKSGRSTCCYWNQHHLLMKGVISHNKGVLSNIVIESFPQTLHLLTASAIKLKTYPHLIIYKINLPK